MDSRRVSQTCAEDQVLAVAAGPIPLLRLFQVPMTVNHSWQNRVSGKWTPATSEAVLDFSAVAYSFGIELVEELNNLVSIIHSSWGDSRIEPWWVEEGLVGIDELATTRHNRVACCPGFQPYDTPYCRYITAVGQ